jgi:hypothetical protein
MGEKRRLDVDGGAPERGHTVAIGRCHAPDHARSEVDQIRRIIYDDGGGGTGAIRIGIGRSGPEHDYLRSHGRLISL